MGGYNSSFSSPQVEQALSAALLQEKSSYNITQDKKQNYASLTEAIAAVSDEKYKVNGLVLTFYTGTEWVSKRYNGTDASGWSDEVNWIDEVPVQENTGAFAFDLWVGDKFDAESKGVKSLDWLLINTSNSYSKEYPNYNIENDTIYTPELFKEALQTGYSNEYIKKLMNSILDGKQINLISRISSNPSLDSIPNSKERYDLLLKNVKKNISIIPCDCNIEYSGDRYIMNFAGRIIDSGNPSVIMPGNVIVFFISIPKSDITLDEDGYHIKSVDNKNIKSQFGLSNPSLTYVYISGLNISESIKSSTRSFSFKDDLKNGEVGSLVSKNINNILWEDFFASKAFPIIMLKEKNELDNNNKFISLSYKESSDGKVLSGIYENEGKPYLIRIVFEWSKPDESYKIKSYTDEEIVASGGTQYLDLTIFSEDSGTLSDEDYQKVVKAYEDGVTVCKTKGDSFEYVYSMTISKTDFYYSISIFDVLTLEPNADCRLTVGSYMVLISDKSYISSSQAISINTLKEFATQVKVVSGGSGAVTQELSPNTYYEFGECTSLTITLASEISGIRNEYMFEFVSGTTPTMLSIPETVGWMGGEAPTIEANKTYQCSIVNNIAVIGGK